MTPSFRAQLLVVAAVHAKLPPVRHTDQPQLFLMFSAARSGSDWLIDLLQTHENICVAFGQREPRDIGRDVDAHVLIENERVKHLIRRGEDIGRAYKAAAEYRLAHPKKHAIAKQPNVNCSVIGWKNSALWVGGSRVNASDADRASFARWIRSDNVKLMFMRRDQPLNWLVSKKRKALTDAMQSGSDSHCRSEECAHKMSQLKVTLRIDKLVSTLQEFTHDWDVVFDWARSSFPSSQYHVVDYDALVNDTQGTLDGTFRWLGLEPVTVHSTFVPTSPKRVEDSIANWDDVRAALKGTKWEI